MNRGSLEAIRSLLEEAEKNGSLPHLLRFIQSFLAERGRLDLWPSTDPPEAAPVAAELKGKFGIVGKSPAIRAVFERIEKVLPSSFPVLIYGESGTGKELVARALHYFGPRKGHPFFSTNCAAIPETLLETELFGHKRGSFTGAVSDRKGHFLSADKGTLFLDEIGDMSSAMQAKLLRVLEDGEIRPVGGTSSIHVDVHVIAASNQKLSDLIKKGSFRQDLFFRLNVLSVELPPLRDRKEDIPLLVEYFVEKVGKEMKKQIVITEEAVKKLQAHNWPGNVRELENEIRRGAALSGGRIDAKDLRSELISEE